MGADVHPYFEARDSEGNWHMIEEVDAGRSYVWFGLAAGVRNRFENSMEPKGMPDNPSWAWEHICERWGPDFHSKTWLTPSELRQVNLLWCQKNFEQWPDEFPDGPKLDEEFIKCIGPDHIITGILIPDKGTKLQKQAFAGTLQDFIGNNDIEDSVRLVLAFDN